MYTFTKTLTDTSGSPKGTWSIKLEFDEDIKIKPNSGWWIDLYAQNKDKVRPYFMYKNSNASILPDYPVCYLNIYMKGDPSLALAETISSIERDTWLWDCDERYQGITPKQSTWYRYYTIDQPRLHNTDASLYFNENNPDESYVEATVVIDYNRYSFISGHSVELNTSAGTVYYSSNTPVVLGTVRLYLDAPPTFSESVVTTGAIYKDITPYQVTISNSDAKMGGNIVHSAVTIGSKTVTGTGDGTLSITPEESGTFTPIVEVEDSRGQVTTKTLPKITVLDYQKPSIQSFELTRSDSNGVITDEGLNSLLSVNYSVAYVIGIDEYGRTVINPATLIKPTVKKNNTDVSNSVNWYSSISESGVSSPITFPYSPPSTTGTIYGVLTTTIPYEDSAQIALTLGDSLGGQSTEITQVLPQAFYTIDFLAGGHGVAFGSPATEEKFKVAMPAEFEDIVAENLTAEEVLLQLDTSATSGVDKEIYDALLKLEWGDVVDTPIIKLDLSAHGSWVDSGTTVDGHTVYQSNGSYHVDDAWDTMRVTFTNVSTFEFYIRSYAQSIYDYILVSTLNNLKLATIQATSGMRKFYNNTEYTKAYTRGKQSETNWEKVEFTDLDPTQTYRFYVIYQKNSSVNSNNDRGYVYFPYD